MLTISQLLGLAAAFQRASALEEKTLSHRVFGDSKKLAALRGGADITTGRFNAAIRWFAANWPEGLDWPEGVERPAPADEVPA